MYSTDPKSHKNNANINTDDEFSPHPQHLFTPVDHAHNNLNKSSSSNYYQEEDETDTLKNERMDCSNSSSFFETYISNNLLILGLISIKLLTQHITGFLVIIGCIATAFTANNRVKLFDRRCVNGRGSIQIEAIGVIVALGVNQYLLYGFG